MQSKKNFSISGWVSDVPNLRLFLTSDRDPLHCLSGGATLHFCDRRLPPAKLRRSNTDASAGSREEIARIVSQIRERWPEVRIILRADSGFAREKLMAQLSARPRVSTTSSALPEMFRLVAVIEMELDVVVEFARERSQAVRSFSEFKWSTIDSWSRQRGVVAKAEVVRGEANPRFVVTSLSTEEVDARTLYDDMYCAPGDMEFRLSGGRRLRSRRRRIVCHHRLIANCAIPDDRCKDARLSTSGKDPRRSGNPTSDTRPIKRSSLSAVRKAG